MLPLADSLTLVIATILLTIAAVLVTFSLLSGVRQTRGLMLAGVFAALYGLRMLTTSMRCRRRSSCCGFAR